MQSDGMRKCHLVICLYSVYIYDSETNKTDILKKDSSSEEKRGQLCAISRH